jgi:hypothetical protein
MHKSTAVTYVCASVFKYAIIRDPLKILSIAEPAHGLFVAAVVTLDQWEPHRCNRSATVSYTPGTAGLAGTAEQPH